MADHYREYILVLFKIVSTTSILVIDRNGILKRLHCPFKVVALVEIPPQIIAGVSYLVDAVKMTLELKEVYIIKGKGYYIWCFKIM